MDDNADRVESRDNSQPIHCLQCGYNLGLLRSHECPECGAAFDSSNQSTYDVSPNAWKHRRWFKRICVMLVITLATSILALVLVWNSDRLSYYFTAWSLEGVTISRLDGFNDTLKFKVHTIELEVEGKGLMAFYCYSPRKLTSASDIYLIKIGPHMVDDIMDQLLDSGEFTAAQQRFLAANRNSGLNVGANGVFFDSSTPPPISIQDAVNHYDEILGRIEELLAAEDEADSDGQSD